jgi:hypothetical protein
LWTRYKGEGLVVLAISSEPLKLVAPYVTEYQLAFPVAAGSPTGGALGKMTGSKSLPHSFLIDPEGNLAWHGHPNSLTDELVQQALRGATKPGPKETLAWRGQIDGAPAGPLADAARGELNMALSALAEDPSPGAEALRLALNSHLGDLRDQIDGMFEQRDVRQGLAALDHLAGEFKGHELGKQLKAALKAKRKDKSVKAELNALTALERALEVGRRRGMKKALRMLEQVSESYPGTKAAERAARIAGEV